MPVINLLTGHYTQDETTGQTKIEKKWKPLYVDALNNRLSADRNLGDLLDTTKALENLNLTGNVITHTHKVYADGLKNLEAELKDTEDRLKMQIDEAKRSMTDSHASQAYDLKSLRDQLYDLISAEVSASSDGIQQEQDARTRQDNYILGLLERKDNERKLDQTTEASARTAADAQLSNTIEAHKEETAKKLDDMKSYTDTRYDDLANIIAQLRNDMKEEAAKAAAANSMPVGCVIAWPLNADIPDGYLECNGQVVNATSYPLLAALMNSTPDMRAVFLQGSGTAGQLVQAGLPNLSGYVYTFTGHKAGDQETDGSLFTIGTSTHSSQTSPGADDGYVKEVRFDASKGNTIYGQSETVQPPAYTVKWIIKAK